MMDARMLLVLRLTMGRRVLAVIIDVICVRGIVLYRTCKLGVRDKIGASAGTPQTPATGIEWYAQRLCSVCITITAASPHRHLCKPSFILCLSTWQKLATVPPFVPAAPSA